MSEFSTRRLTATTYRSPVYSNRQRIIPSEWRRAAYPAVDLALIFLCLVAWMPLRVVASPLAPGMFEARHQHTAGYDQQNFSLWSPLATGGGGRIAPDRGEVIDYGNLGLTTAPLFDAPSEALVMYGFVHTPGTSLDEKHGEYRWKFSDATQIAIGGGVTDIDDRREYGYGKLGIRSVAGRAKYIFYLTGSSFDGVVSPGFYSAVYNDEYFAGGEYGGDRSTMIFGYTSNAQGEYFRPAFEYFAFERDLGRVGGAEYLAAAATLRFHDFGYFTMPSRLGRALGPAGMQLTNPIGFLLPTWNRRADSWEVGRLLSAGYREFQAAPGAPRSRDGDVVLFPADLVRNKSVLQWLFIGAAWRDDGQGWETNPILGIHVNTPCATLSAIWQGKSNFTLNLQVPWGAGPMP